MPYDRFTVIEIAPRFLNRQQLDACAKTAYQLADSGHYSHLAVLADVLAASLREDGGVMVPEIGQVAIPEHSDGVESCRGSGLYIGDGSCGFCDAVFCADCASPNARSYKDYDDALCSTCAEARESRALATTDRP